MPGSGKTTLGQKLAALAGKSFIDLDEEIEVFERQSIPDIFAKKGESYFRVSESELLAEIIKSKNDFVLSTGGGTPCFYENIDLMLKAGRVIYINVPLHSLVARLKSSKTDRPKFKNADDLQEEIKTLLELRTPFYKKAQLEVEGDQIQAADVFKALEIKS